MGILSGKRPNNLGVSAGNLAPCPSSSNCVSSQGDGKHYIKPFTFVSDAANAWTKLRDILLNSKGVTLIEDSDTYIHAECRTKMMGFVDDLEFYLRFEEQVIHVRSASRLGYSDLGKNRKRVEETREKLEDKKDDHTAKAYFAGGCFWGVEYLFEHKQGVISAVSGYMGGHTKNPTCQDVCSGKTGHLEVVEIRYDPKKVSYENLARLFFEIHDPTQINGQGPDMGEQYLSAIFYTNDDEKKMAHKLIDILKAKGYEIVTKVLPVGKFWKAEEHHQDYYDKKKQKPYCHVYQKKF